MGSWATVIATSAGVGGAILTLWMAVPQALMIWRDGSALGVSYGTWTLFCLSFSLWIGYSIRVGNEIILASNILSLTTASMLMVGLARVAPGTPASRSWLLVALAVGALVLCLVGLSGPVALVAVLLLAAVFVRGPQLVRSVRTYRAAARSEVSMTSWWVSLGGGVCWLVHGAFRPDRFIVLASIGVIALSAGVLAFEHAGRARSLAASALSG